MKKQTLLLSLTLFIGIGLSTLFMVLYNRNGAEEQQPPQGVNSFIIDSLYQQYDQNGKIHLQIQVKKGQHTIQHSLSKYIKPRILFYTARHIPWHISANYGTSEYLGDTVKSQNEKIYLYDHVVLHQPQRPHYPETTITTSTLTIYPQRSQAQTDQPVTVTRPGTHIHGTGMKANLKTNTITILKQSRGTYEAP